MSFMFNWPEWAEEQVSFVSELLNKSLNAGDRPPEVVDKIEVIKLELGTVPPDIEILDVGDLSETHFRGILKLAYHGDASLMISTRAQVNPVHPMKRRQQHNSTGVLAASKPLILPIQLRISDLKLSAIYTLDVDIDRGVTLSFKNDPLKGLALQTPFDDQPSIKEMLQNNIENSLRDLFNIQLPHIVHEYSLKAFAQIRRRMQEGASFSDDPLGTPTFATPKTTPPMSPRDFQEYQQPRRKSKKLTEDSLARRILALFPKDDDGDGEAIDLRTNKLAMKLANLNSNFSTLSTLAQPEESLHGHVAFKSGPQQAASVTSRSVRSSATSIPNTEEGGSL